MHFTLVDVLMDFAKISMLLIAGSFLRRKIKLFQYYYIPVALIAGVLGLLLGKEVLGSVSPYYLGYSPAIRQFAGISSAIVFSCSFLGVKLAKMEKSAFQTYFLAGSIHQMQVIVGLTLAFIFAMFNSDFPVGFGIFPVLGFYGGHPIAIAAGTIFDDAGYMTTGSQVGATFSTIGLIIGVVAGMILINKAAAKGITAVAMRREDMPKSLLTGYYKPDERPEMCKQATFAPSLDPLASQVMLVGFVVCCGYIIRMGLIRIDKFFTHLPLFACCLIFGVIFCLCTQKNEMIQGMIDRATVIRISGTSIEYMIASSIAITSISVFTTYAVPIVVMSVVIALGTYWMVFKMGKKMLSQDGGFETELGLFGQCCAMLSIGLLLLKVVDPDYKTPAVANITTSCTLGYTYQLQYTLILIVLLMTSPVFVYLWSWLLFLILFGCGLYFGKKWNKTA